MLRKERYPNTLPFDYHEVYTKTPTINWEALAILGAIVIALVIFIQVF